jgi:citrate synthase
MGFPDLAMSVTEATCSTCTKPWPPPRCAEKGLRPNLDCSTCPADHLVGFDIPVFTPNFVVGCITGWAAHIDAQLGCARELVNC